MYRRDLLKVMAAGSVLATIGRSGHAAPSGWRQFEITYRVKLDTLHVPARLWIPVPQDMRSTISGWSTCPGDHRRPMSRCGGRARRVHRS